MSTDQKFTLFRRAFLGRTDVYPLLTNDTCNSLAVDFDDAEWREDAKGFAKSCSELGVPVALEISRSGESAHAWVFFSASVAARDARRLGTALIGFTCAWTRQLKLTSYDRLFPSQDTLPKGGSGNLIALPLQKLPRELGRSVFVDEVLQPFPDQWAFLKSVRPMEPHDIEPAILRAIGSSHPLDVTFVADDGALESWKPRPSANTIDADWATGRAIQAPAASAAGRTAKMRP